MSTGSRAATRTTGAIPTLSAVRHRFSMTAGSSGACSMSSTRKSNPAKAAISISAGDARLTNGPRTVAPPASRCRNDRESATDAPAGPSVGATELRVIDLPESKIRKPQPVGQASRAPKAPRLFLAAARPPTRHERVECTPTLTLQYNSRDSKQARLRFDVHPRHGGKPRRDRRSDHAFAARDGNRVGGGSLRHRRRLAPRAPGPTRRSRSALARRSRAISV